MLVMGAQEVQWYLWKTGCRLNYVCPRCRVEASPTDETHITHVNAVGAVLALKPASITREAFCVYLIGT